MAQSAGAMVNYLYDLKRVAQNHEKFATKHAIAASADVRALAGTAQISAVEER
jgi:malonyl-CoA decarboxylase